MQKEGATTTNTSLKVESKEYEQISNGIDINVAKNSSLVSPSKTPNSTSSQVEFCFLLVYIRFDGSSNENDDNHLIEFFVRIIVTH